MGFKNWNRTVFTINLKKAKILLVNFPSFKINGLGNSISVWTLRKHDRDS